jgi:hypothetical protein
MKIFNLTILLLIAGALGGVTNSIVVWALGTTGFTSALGFTMAPDFTIEWLTRRVIPSALWGLLFLIPTYPNNPVKKGLIISVLPWLSSVLIVFPYFKDVGFFGLGFGIGTPLWTLLFAAIWGVTGTLFLTMVHNLSEKKDYQR